MLKGSIYHDAGKPRGRGRPEKKPGKRIQDGYGVNASKIDERTIGGS